MKLLIILPLLISNLSLAADCNKPVTKIQEGEKAVCTGYLFSPETELKARTAVAVSDKKDEIIKLQEDMLKIQNDRVDNLEKQINNLESSSFWGKTVYFGLGVLITGFLANNINR